MSESFCSCCVGCTKNFKNFFDMPLSMYVVLSIAASAYFGYDASSTMGILATEPPTGQHPTGKNGTVVGAGCTDSPFLMLIMAYSAVFALFSIYLQCRVSGNIVNGHFPAADGPFDKTGKNTNRWKFIQYIKKATEDKENAAKAAAEKEKKDPGYLTQLKTAGASAAAQAQATAQQAGYAAAKADNNDAEAQTLIAQEVGEEEDRVLDVPQDVIRQAFRNVFYEDLGVLAMFVVMCGMCVVGFKPSTVPGEKDSTCAAGKAGMAPLYYFGFSALFTFCYMCCSCCSGSIMIDDPESPPKPFDENDAEWKE